MDHAGDSKNTNSADGAHGRGLAVARIHVHECAEGAESPKPRQRVTLTAISSTKPDRASAFAYAANVTQSSRKDVKCTVYSPGQTSLTISCIGGTNAMV